MPFDATSLASTTNSSVRNTQFLPFASNLPRKYLIIGSYDPAKTTIVDNVPAFILGPEDAGSTYGFGSMIHRLALSAFKGTQGLPIAVVPQPEAGGAAAAVGEIDFTPTTVEAGTVHLYIAGSGHVPFNIAASATKEEIADACVAAITADTKLPITATKTAITFEVVTTAKTKGTYGNEISIEFNLNAGQVLPTGLVGDVTDMAAGTGTPVIQDALDGLGTGDNSNQNWFTDVVHGYLQDSATLDAIETYGGTGNDFVGLYSKTVGRPFRVATGDTTAGSGGLTALIALSDLRKNDRVNGIVPAPGSPNHPSEIAAEWMGHMARINQNIVAQHYKDIILDIFAGSDADDWTKDYSNRDLAVKSGISTTQNKNGSVTIQDATTFYRPDNVPVTSNGYRAMVNIAKLQNIIDFIRINFSQEKWQGIFIVDNKSIVAGIDKLKARDTQDVIDDDFNIADQLAAKGWIYSAKFTKDELSKPGAVEVRDGGTGFDNNLKIVLSGVGGILDTVSEFDISLAVFDQPA